MDKTIVSSIDIAVRDTELDPYQIAHHSNYAIWSELGVQDFLDKAGITDLYEVKHFFCKYIASAKQKDVITVRTKLKSEADNCLTFMQEILISMRLIVKCEITVELICKDNAVGDVK